MRSVANSIRRSISAALRFMKHSRRLSPLGLRDWSITAELRDALLTPADKIVEASRVPDRRADGCTKQCPACTGSAAAKLTITRPSFLGQRTATDAYDRFCRVRDTGLFESWNVMRDELDLQVATPLGKLAYRTSKADKLSLANLIKLMDELEATVGRLEAEGNPTTEKLQLPLFAASDLRNRLASAAGLAEADETEALEALARRLGEVQQRLEAMVALAPGIRATRI